MGGITLPSQLSQGLATLHGLLLTTTIFALFHRLSIPGPWSTTSLIALAWLPLSISIQMTNYLKLTKPVTFHILRLILVLTSSLATLILLLDQPLLESYYLFSKRLILLSSLWLINHVLLISCWMVAFRQKQDPIYRQTIGLFIITCSGFIFMPVEYYLLMIHDDYLPWLLIILSITSLLPYLATSHYPFFKPFVPLRFILKYMFSFTLLAIPLAALIYLILGPSNISLLNQVPGLLLIAFMFYYLIIQPSVTRILPIIFKEHYQAKQRYQSFLNKLVLIKDPGHMVNEIETFIHQFSNLSPSKLLMKSAETNHIILEDAAGVFDLSREYFPLFNWLIHHGDILMMRDIPYLPPESPSPKLWYHFFDKLQAMAVIPLIVSHQMVGLIVISHKIKTFTHKDYFFIINLKSVFAIALYNALFYEQIRQLSRNLWEVNELLHDKINDKNQSLEEALARTVSLKEEQQSFFTMSSHNLKTPLTSIKAATSMLWSQLPNDEFKQGLNRILTENIQRLDELLNNIILISRLQDNQSLDYAKFDFHFLIYSVQQQINAVFQDKTIDWTIDLNPAAKWIEGNEYHLRIVCFHLIYNACKFSANGGQVKISLELMNRPQRLKFEKLIPSNISDHNLVELAITDQGEGIPDFEKESIFNSFHQVKQSLKRYQGNGLGLFIVKRILQVHHGAITLTSQLHRGTTFFIALPVNSNSHPWGYHDG